MICPKCRRSFYFLKGRDFQSGAKCTRCRHEGKATQPSYDSYHTDLYLTKPYRRDIVTDPQMRQIFAELSIQPNDVVVDLGCGVGDYTKAIHAVTSKVAGYDLDVRGAKGKYPQLSFFNIDFSRQLPLPDASADKVVSINVIEHLADFDYFLRECARILKPGGSIALSTANRDFLLHDFHYDATHLHEWTVDEFEDVTAPYFDTTTIRKDCAMFKYYPVNLWAGYFLKPDITWLGTKRV